MASRVPRSAATHTERAFLPNSFLPSRAALGRAALPLPRPISGRGAALPYDHPAQPLHQFQPLPRPA